MDTDTSIDRYHAKLLTMMDKSLTSNDVNYLLNIFTRQITTIENLKQKVKNQATAIENLQYDRECSNKSMVEADQRFIQTLVVDSSTSKLTINPVDGRITLKVSKQASPAVCLKYQELAEMIRKCTAFIPFTYRGRIKYSVSGKCYGVTLSTDMKRNNDSITFTVLG